MDFLTMAKERYSVRKYKDTPVEAEKLQKILEAGRIAPTAANLQPQRILVLQSKEALEKAKDAARFYDAPVLLVVCADKDSAWVRKTDGFNAYQVDASIVTDHMMLQATELGLGTLWICWFKEDVLRQQFNIPENLVPVNLLAIGYADCKPSSPDRHTELRKPLDETVKYL
ncbi:MAG: nitroreductase family protein [Oscillospiraceae bacterium]|nr:nitroreductase family protein [Oscillospiraceae bacterium]